MRIEYELRSRLPPLSWCARVRRGGALQVIHGADIETRPEGFVEGAWDGEFDAFDFDRAATLAGSGARLRGEAIVFATPFHPLERLFVLRREGETLVSNSLVFLLAEAGVGLDLSHSDYFFDFVRQVRTGVAVPAHLRTASAERVEVLRCCNLVWNDGRERQEPKSPLPAPACFADYFALLDGATRALARNALEPQRRKTYRLVAACSRGYDSTASAALASRAGCTEGVTFAQSATVVAGSPFTRMTVDLADDSGAEALRALGMSVREYDRAALADIPGFNTAEFYINSMVAMTDASTRIMEDALRGTVYVSGRHGERYWGPTTRCRRLHFRELDDCHLSGQALAEFRLRAGFLHYPAPYVGALHGPAILRITHSEEMRPWKLGTGYYDRPIARRIAEEAGVPREAFGQRKLGAGASSSWRLNPESAQDFEDFLRSEVPPSILRTLDTRPPSERRARHRQLAHVRTLYSHLPLAAALLDVLQSDRLHTLWRSPRLYEFHWGFAKLIARYASH